VRVTAWGGPFPAPSDEAPGSGEDGHTEYAAAAPLELWRSSMRRAFGAAGARRVAGGEAVEKGLL